MAFTSRELPRAQWQQYFDDLSREMKATVASIEVSGLDTGAQIEAERGLLTGVSYDHGDDVMVVGLKSESGATEELERVVSAPRAIYIGTDQSRSVLDIEDAEGRKTLVRMEQAAPLPPGG